MSASLVGSEMCIRDSIPAFAATLLRWSGMACLVPRAGKQSRQCLQPVSYTHLTLPTICSV
eukprot:2279964-Alexandrium_andersonii.AAC.1